MQQRSNALWRGFELVHRAISHLVALLFPRGVWNVCAVALRENERDREGGITGFNAQSTL